MRPMREDTLAAFGIRMPATGGLRPGGSRAPLELEMFGQGCGPSSRVHLQACPSSSYCCAFLALSSGVILSLTP